MVVSRRTFLRRGAVVGALVAVPGLACGTNDAEVFANAGSLSDPATDPSDTSTTSQAESTTSEAESTTTEAESTTTEADEPGTTVASPGVFPPGAELAVTFTYQPSDSGQTRNPYVAVWVEDSDGNLVDTISVWFLQSQKGLRWLDDLRRWYSVSGQGADTTMSGATRVAGSYSVVWDGTDLAGAPIAQGDYVLYIEAARERGPYSITSTSLTIGETATTAAFADDGEITAASAELILGGTP